MDSADGCLSVVLGKKLLETEAFSVPVRKLGFMRRQRNATVILMLILDVFLFVLPCMLLFG